MQDALGPGTILGYCTNVHAGTTLEQVCANLEQHSQTVKNIVSPAKPMGIGLWLSAQTARQLIDDQQIEAFSDWLIHLGLTPFTFNGFPYGNFHGATVKHRVYQPDWQDPKRLAYTLDLITIMAGLLSGQRNNNGDAYSNGDSPIFATQKSGQPPEGSISTLPIAWNAHNGVYPIHTATEHLLETIEYLYQTEQETGKLIHLNIEPEPGCVLQTSQDVVDFFEHHLDKMGCAQRNRRYLKVCLDTCHEAIMFENNRDVLQRFNQAGIKIGKVQISSALQVRFDQLDGEQRHSAIESLKQFCEDRYLHQTVVQTTDPSRLVGTTFYDDLPAAIASYSSDHRRAEIWRVHYHVPLFLERIGILETTINQTIDSLKRIAKQTLVHHFEIETYAWDVLPAPLAADNLAQGIARELSWLIAKWHAEVKP